MEKQLVSACYAKFFMLKVKIKLYLTKEILNLYNLPLNLKKIVNSSIIDKIKKDIFKNIFLDKKELISFKIY